MRLPYVSAVLLAAACQFPRPADIPTDAGPADAPVDARPCDEGN